MSKPFVHLHTHSHYSLLDGLSKVEDLVARAKELGMTALALTDHGNMHGAIEFYKTCKKAGIKPIIGVEAYMAERTRFDMEHGIDSKRYHLTLLAKNKQGYQNLMKMVTASHLEGYYYKPRMDEDLLKQYHEGIICLTGCPNSRFIQHIKNKRLDKARELLQWYIDTFGKENVFVEVMQHPEVDWYTKELVDDLKIIAKEFDRPIVGTWDSHYLHKDDRNAHDTLLAINTNAAETGKNFKLDGDYSFISPDEAHDIFKDIPGAGEDTMKVADSVDIELELGKWVFPNLPLDEGSTYEEKLEKSVTHGIQERNYTMTPEAEKRVEYELSVIKNKGYAPYFLVVGDLLRFARKSGILTTIRGSVAGSLVTYLIGITNVDPLEYKLPFERFLNPERPSAPDIDMDYADNRRDEMIEYAKEKYGADKVAQIGTFGTMMARGAVRDVARALGYPYDLGDRISKLIPMGSQGFPMTLEYALEITPELADMYKKESDARKVIDMAKKIEGCVRHVSVHAAGVVIAPSRLDDFVPLQLDPKGGKIITQYDMHAVEDAGLLKFDFLGIRNLAILEDAVARVKSIRGIEIDIEKIPLDDKKTFEMLARGETMGVFQLGGSGMTRYLKELKPSSIHDINAMVALYRPGPMESIPEYIKRKYNSKLVSYLDPRMKDILDRSYGVITYQDDVLLIAIHLAGFSWLEADTLRKAMGKKIPEVMAEQKQKLLDGFIKNGLDQKKASQLWELIEPFAAYGFNKAHAASYGRVAYQTAYMKANFPAEYMTAVLTAESGDLEKTAEVIAECKRMGFEVLPPEVNESFSDFTAVQMPEGTVTNKIRFGLRTIKNFGEEIGRIIIENRKAKGNFKSIEDFLERVKHRNLNKKSLEALIMTGAMDSLGERGRLLKNTETLLSFNRELGQGDANQVSLFGTLASAPKANLTLEDFPEATQEEKLAWEKELLGLYISGHPLDKHREKLEKNNMNIKHIKASVREGITLVVAGIVQEIREVITKNQQRMAFIKIEDLSGTIEAVVFPKTYEEFKHLLSGNKVIAVKAKVSDRNGERSLVVEKVKELI